MKTIKQFLTVFAILCIAAFISVLSEAEGNYNRALRAARHCEGSDAAIEETMSKYGFTIDACDPNEPSIKDKIKALFN